MTLDDVDAATLTTDDLLICDGHDAPVGIAGIMGGASSEIDDATTEVALEMAWFEPVAIATTAARLGLRSEASARFERGVDPMVTDRAIARFVELLRETSPDGGVAPGAVDARGDLPAPAVVRVRPERVNALLGTPFTMADIAALIEPIGFAVDGDAGDGAVVAPRLHRRDRHRRGGRPPLRLRAPRQDRAGVDPSGPPDAAAARPAPGAPGAGGRRARRGHAAARSSRPTTSTRAGLPGEGIALTNPLAAEESILRPSLRPGLLKAIAYNASHRATGVALFEIGHVFLPPPAGQLLPDEREVIGAALAGREAPAAVALWAELANALGVDGRGARGRRRRRAARHPHRAAWWRPTATRSALVGEIDPGVLERHGIAERVAWLEVDLEPLLARAQPDRPYRRVSRYPSSDIDLAFVLDEAVPAATLTAALRAAGGRAGGRSAPVRRVPRPGRAPRATAAWPTACGSRRPTARSPTPTWPRCASACIAAAAAVGAVLRA